MEKMLVAAAEASKASFDWRRILPVSNLPSFYYKRLKFSYERLVNRLYEQVLANVVTAIAWRMKKMIMIKVMTKIEKRSQ